MKPTILMKNLVLTASVLAVVTSVGCGRKREKDKDSEAKATPKVVVAPSAPVQDSQKEVASEQDLLNADLETLTEPIYEYDPLDPDNVVKAAKVKRLTGAQNDAGLAYTDASSDYLMTFLRLRADEVKDPIPKERNLKLAMAIESAQVQRDALGNVTLRLKLKEEGSRDVTAYELKGKAKSDSRKVELKSSAVLDKTMDKMSAEFRCVDLNEETCETSFVRLVKGQPGQRAFAAIVLRDTSARLEVKMNLKDSINASFRELRTLFLNTMFNEQGDKLKTINMKSFSVVNGKSKFNLKLLSEEGEVITAGGSLLTPSRAATDVSLLADRTMQLNDLLDNESLQRRSTRLNDSIQEIRIVNNNGLGQLKLDLKMNSQYNEKAEELSIVVTREVKPILFVSEESLYY